MEKIEDRILEIAKEIRLLQKNLDEIDRKIDSITFEENVKKIFNLKVLLQKLEESAYLEMEPTIVGEEIDLYLKNIDSKLEEAPAEHRYIITLHDTKTIIGNVEVRFSLLKYQESYGNIGTEIYEEYKGKRYSKKTFLLLRDVFLEQGVTKPIFTVNKNNTSSIISLDNIGATRLEDNNDSYYSYEYDLLDEKHK